VEHGHGVLKNDLGGGTMPCGRFGANAAWWRLNMLTHDLFELVKAQALPGGMAATQPRTPRFELPHFVGRLVRYARRWVLRLFGGHPMADVYIAVRLRLVELAAALRGPVPTPT
jgi:hypothetical protein